MRSRAPFRLAGLTRSRRRGRPGTRRLFDLDADPVAIDAAARWQDPLLRRLIRRRPRLRVRVTPNGFELVVRAIIGQQVSVAGARTDHSVGSSPGKSASRSTPRPRHDHARLPGRRDVMATIDPRRAADAEGTRRVARRGGSPAIARRGTSSSTPGPIASSSGPRLLALPGIGPWTVEYVMMRAVGDPDAFLASDLGGVRRALEVHGLDARPAERWSPWRSYAIASCSGLASRA